ncbi:hypothetical protein IQ07DRAFT_12731 [Pyrenochaeta sp. DS3sAY3a]|nr:hypothetical protein IQ07DRAFT_12731 [Pyrenochaeta sp. DS3sAY3a]
MLDSQQYFGDDDANPPRSPPLEAVVVNIEPIKEPPPIVSSILSSPSRAPIVSQSSSRRHKKSNRLKTMATQGDWVLLREMDPNRPDIAERASRQALHSDSDSDPDDDMSDVPAASSTVSSTLPSADQRLLQQTAQIALTNPTDQPHAKPIHRDSVVEADDPKPSGLGSDRRASQVSTVAILPNNARPNTNGTNLSAAATSILAATSPNQAIQLHGALTNGHPHENPLASSPRLQQLTISQSRVSLTDTLPALQTQSPPRDGTAASPNQQHQLPSFRHLDDIARSATSNQEANRGNGFIHRQSISSVGQSPTSIGRHLSISSHSPATPFPPLSASSPISATSEVHRPDLFLKSTGGSVFNVDARRPSQASDVGPFGSALHSTTTSDSYQSSEGLSPGTAQTPVEGRPRHMSLDGALASRLLPPPLALQHLPALTAGTFKCDYPSCNAAPFQTQYLLNSHANVHSQSRPHYCPVADCPRGEGGKGFKRKNEMIRHGLVHQSPGYVCPFCPDREHKYPRPDNLQRHVRVHHVDKDKDDIALREVLAQRPEGGSRGRRRRVSEGC